MSAIYTVLKNLYKHLPDIKGRHHIKELRALSLVLQRDSSNLQVIIHCIYHNNTNISLSYAKNVIPKLICMISVQGVC